MIRIGQPADAARICEIYNVYVRDTVITFEEEPVTNHEMARRIAEITQSFPWLVWEIDGLFAGYAYAATWKTRSAYRHSVETTVYVAPDAARRGIGSSLYLALIDDLTRINVHCIVAGISLPNAASVALHEKLGFTHVGRFDAIGFKFGNWVDVDYWQRLL